MTATVSQVSWLFLSSSKLSSVRTSVFPAPPLEQAGPWSPGPGMTDSYRPGTWRSTPTRGWRWCRGGGSWWCGEWPGRTGGTGPAPSRWSSSRWVSPTGWRWWWPPRRPSTATRSRWRWRRPPRPTLTALQRDFLPPPSTGVWSQSRGESSPRRPPSAWPTSRLTRLAATSVWRRTVRGRATNFSR